MTDKLIVIAGIHQAIALVAKHLPPPCEPDKHIWRDHASEPQYNRCIVCWYQEPNPKYDPEPSLDDLCIEAPDTRGDPMSARNARRLAKRRLK